MLFETKSDYILEKDVGVLLESIFPEKTIIHNKKHELGFRPDYYLPDLKLFVEFDGPTHFTNNRIVISDIIKEKLAKEAGISVVRIPYFLQLSRPVIDSLFITYNHTFPKNDYNSFSHGFVDSKAVLPGVFSTLGVKRYDEYLKFLLSIEREDVVEQITRTLVEKYMFQDFSFFECFPSLDIKKIKEAYNVSCYILYKTYLVDVSYDVELRIKEDLDLVGIEVKF